MKCSSVLVASALACWAQPAFSQEQAAPSTLEAGGLRPPEAVDPAQQAPADAAATPSPEKELEEADREDSGRGLEWVWLNAEIGAQHLGLQTFKQDGLVDGALVKTNQTGLLFGAGIGVRILVFTAGVRFRLGSFSEWKLWTLNAEGGLRIPIGSLEPYFTVGAGYAALGSFDSKLPSFALSDAKGFNARLGAGVDYYLSNTFSVGASFSGDVLFLSRSAVTDASAASGDDDASVYTKDGSSIGAGATLTAVVGLHF